MRKINNCTKWLRESPVRFFIVVSIVFGFLFLSITPPFQAPDEAAHFYRAYQVSEFNLSVDVVDGITGGLLPESLAETVILTDQGLPFNSNKKYSVRRGYESLRIDLEKSEERLMEFSSTAQNTPIPYLPQSVGIFMGRVVSLPAIILMYLGRLFNLIVWVALIAASIIIVPSRKWAFAFVGLLPMSISQAASLSTDSMAVGLAALFFAVVLRLRQDNKPLSKKTLTLIFTLAVAMVLAKQVTLCFLPLIFLVPDQTIGSRRRAIVYKILVSIVPILLLLAWLYGIRTIDVAASNTNGQSPGEQIRYVLSNPLRFVNVLWNTYFFTWGDGIVRSVIGTFGWVDTPLALVWVIFGYISYALISMSTIAGVKSKEMLSRANKTMIFITAGLFIILVSAALYAFYSPVGFKIVYGLQGRYFLPVLFLLIPVLKTGWLQMKKSVYYTVATVSPLILLTVSIITLFYRYYINNV